MSHLAPRVDLTRTLVSERTSASHFVPLCREKVHRSDANQAETAVRPTMLHAEKTVVRVHVILCCGILINLLDTSTQTRDAHLP